MTLCKKKVKVQTDWDVLGCAEYEVDEDRVEGGVKAEDWRHRSQQGVRHTCSDDGKGNSLKQKHNELWGDAVGKHHNYD